MGCWLVGCWLGCYMGHWALSSSSGQMLDQIWVSDFGLNEKLYVRV